MIVQHNIAAMNTNRMLGTATKKLGKATEKLSSGYRINRAADDAAGLAISEKMRGQIRGLNQASNNSQDGISLIQTAEGALNEAQSILHRMRELSVQAANETNTEADREEIQKEIIQLSSEINRIANSTEFNTMALLKGDTSDAQIFNVSTNELLAANVVETQGSISDLAVQQKSIIGKESVTYIRASSSKTTAKFSEPKISVEGAKGTPPSTTFGGLTFTANATGTTGNGVDIVLKKATGGAAVSTANFSAAPAPGVLTIELTENDLNEILSAESNGSTASATLMSKINNAGLTGVNVPATPGVTFSITVPEGEDTANDILFTVNRLKAGDTLSSKTSGGKNEINARYTFNIEDIPREVGDTITIAGTTLVMVPGNASSAISAAGEVGVKTTPLNPNFYNAIKNAFVSNDKFDMTIDPNGKVTLTEKTNQGGTTKLSDVNVIATGSGTDDYIKISDPSGQNLVQFKFTSAASSAAPAAVTANLVSGSKTSGDTLIEIKLTNDASKNTADLIQEAIRKMPYPHPSGIDFRYYNVEAFGNWDIAVSGNQADATDTYMNTAWNTTSGGIETKQGKYTFDISSVFGSGDELVVDGHVFRAGVSQDTRNGIFAIDNTVHGQADNIVNALKANMELSSKYTITVSTTGNTITLEEIIPSGKDMTVSDVRVQDGASTKGVYTASIPELITDGGKFVIDGEEILVSNKNAHTGYDIGTAIQEAGSLDIQMQALADAINKNANLNKKYEVSFENGMLKLVQKIASETAPDIRAVSGTNKDFEIRLQIGANTGQSMTVNIADNRALALGIVGDGSTNTIMAKNGAVASFVEVANVNSGTDNANIEFSLDVTTHEKATAALSVLDDALNHVSSQRASLGAFQNRLEYTIANLDNTAENLQTAESSIRDVDMADEMVEFSKNNIIQQAAQSMLAQANQQTQGILSLLQG